VNEPIRTWRDQAQINNPYWHLGACARLYRNVYLHVTDPLHISLPLYSFLQNAGPYVYTTGVSTNAATVNLEVPVENGRSSDEKISVTAQIFDRTGKIVLTLNQNGDVAAGAHAQLNLSARSPAGTWEPDYPYLYHVILSLT